MELAIFMENIRYLRCFINNNIAFRIKLQDTPSRYNSPKGEVDIIIDAAKRMYFDETYISTDIGFSKIAQSINSISWHGFYEKLDDRVKFPVINFKSDNKKIEEFRHTGTVNQKDIFLFPICSIYVPNTFSSNQYSKIEYDNAFILNLESHFHSRVDFFVLPKGINFDSFMQNFTIAPLCFMNDIAVFNKNLNGAIYPLPGTPEFRIFNLGGWDTLCRIIYTNKTREPDLIGKYSILFHDPFDTINMLLERRILYPNDTNGIVTTVKERHDQELKSYKK